MAQCDFSLFQANAERAEKVFFDLGFGYSLVQSGFEERRKFFRFWAFFGRKERQGHSLSSNVPSKHTSRHLRKCFDAYLRIASICHHDAASIINQFGEQICASYEFPLKRPHHRRKGIRILVQRTYRTAM